MAEKFTAEMARATMPDTSKFEELVKDCHAQIAAAAAEGKYVVYTSFSDDHYSRSQFFQLKDFLRKEGYEVAQPLLANYFIIDWRENK